MRVKIEKFLKSNWYLTLVFGFAWLIWSIRGPKIDNQFYLVNVIGLIVLAVMFLLVSAFFENAFYTIPILPGLFNKYRLYKAFCSQKSLYNYHWDTYLFGHGYKHLTI